MTTGQTERKAEHTPGPWHLPHEDSPYWRHGATDVPISCEPGHTVARVPTSYSTYTTGAANARLIAAAPELLLACKAVVDRWESGDLAEAARMCEAAIAEAKGE